MMGQRGSQHPADPRHRSAALLGFAAAVASTTTIKQARAQILLQQRSSPSPRRGAHHLSSHPCWGLEGLTRAPQCHQSTRCHQDPAVSTRPCRPPARSRAAAAASSTPIKSQSSSHNQPLFSHPHKCPKHLHFRLKFPMFNLCPKEKICGESPSKFPSSICNLSAKNRGKPTLFQK